MKTIIRAPHSGFCFGVKQAIEKADKLPALVKASRFIREAP